MLQTAGCRSHCPRTRAAFTLVEVLLGVFIAVGMLLVLLYFYQKAADLRAQLMEETERLMAVRLVMERLTAELRCAQGPATARHPFVGEATALQFVTATHPRLAAWSSGPLTRSGPPDTGLKLVSYTLGSRLEGSNAVVSGLVRTERSAVPTQGPASPPARPKPKASDEAAEPEQEQNSTELDSSTAESNEAVAASAPAASRRLTPAAVTPVIEAIRFVRFRYRGASSSSPEANPRPKGRSSAMGASLEDWQETWTGPGLPQAVEVSLGTEPLPPDTAPEDYPHEVFRRVIYLPSHAASSLWAEEAPESPQPQTDEAP